MHFFLGHGIMEGVTFFFINPLYLKKMINAFFLGHDIMDIDSPS